MASVSVRRCRFVEEDLLEWVGSSRSFTSESTGELERFVSDVKCPWRILDRFARQGPQVQGRDLLHLVFSLYIPEFCTFHIREHSGRDIFGSIQRS